MPWSNQSGGGGDKNGGGPWKPTGGGGGPWGQRPEGGGGGGNRPSGNTPPDLEEILRRGQDRLKQVLPGGGGTNPLFIGLIAAGAIALWFMQAIYTVQPDEQAVELRFGKPKAEISAPGLHFHFWPIETYEKIQTAEKQVNVGSDATRGTGTGLMLSGDQNIVDVRFSVLYQVIDPASYLFKVEEPDDMVRQVTESAMREVVGRRPVQDIFRDKRAEIAAEVRTITQQTLDGYGAGVQINQVPIEDAAPPQDVADAFDEVQRAEQDEDRFVEEANKYANEQLGKARGEAAQIAEEAAAYKNRVVQEAQGEASRFLSIYDQYVKAPEVTRKRMFLETMEGVLRDSNKVIVEQGSGGQGVVPYLPLNQLSPRQPGATQP
jgi:modulator of FtsH protease HflK